MEKKTNQCDPCQEQFRRGVDQVVDQVEHYTQTEHQYKEREVESAFSTSQPGQKNQPEQPTGAARSGIRNDGRRQEGQHGQYGIPTPGDRSGENRQQGAPGRQTPTGSKEWQSPADRRQGNPNPSADKQKGGIGK